MTTISLSATETLLDLMPGQAGRRKASVVASVAEAHSSGARGPIGLRLLPRTWRQALEGGARQRELDEAFQRLSETSAHLLADAGFAEVKVATTAPAVTWTRALPAPGATIADELDRGTLSRSRRRLAELEDHLLADVGLTRSQTRQEARRPRWDAPDRPDRPRDPTSWGRPICLTRSPP
jgi:uncharacterized protein YjiS (DUF1127 family)